MNAPRIRRQDPTTGHAPGGDALGTKAVRLLTCWLAAFCLLGPCLLPICATGASAEEFRTPSISAVRVEWRAVQDQLRAEINSQPAVVSAFTFASQRRAPGWDPRSRPALVQLNAITAPVFPGIGRSPVPVLLPLDVAAYLDARQSGVPDSLLNEIAKVLTWPATHDQVVAASRLVPDEIVQMITASGTADECREQVAAYIRNGATCPILYPLGDDVHAMIDAFSDWRP